MSEYQYHELQAVDRPLTQEQMGELRAYSSRAQITPSRPLWRKPGASKSRQKNARGISNRSWGRRASSG